MKKVPRYRCRCICARWLNSCTGAGTWPRCTDSGSCRCSPPPTVSAGETRYDNDGEDYLEDPVSQVTKQAAAQGASKASGGNGKVVQGEGNVVNTQQVTHIHHHHYTTNNSSLNVNQPPRH
jgi:hypothetical protein